MQWTQQNLFGGQLLRDTGTALVTEHNPNWTESAIEEIKRVVLVKGVVSADDIRSLPAPPNPNCVGAAFLAVARSGMIRESGRRTKSSYKSTHARKITIWELSPTQL